MSQTSLSAYKKVWSLVLLFALPALLAAGLYLVRDQFKFTSKSEGLLLNPPLSFAHVQLSDFSDHPMDAATFTGHWWLIYVTPPTCTDACGTQNAKLRSVYLALTKNMSRVKRLMLLQTNALTPEQLPQVLRDQPLTIARIKNPDYLLATCKVATAEGLFIMDPLGNIMLCYTPQQEAHAILQDLEKLLKTSRIG